MCSVIGVLSTSGKDVSHETLELMKALQHRGPEAFGAKTTAAENKSTKLHGFTVPTGEAALAHCLLSTTGYATQPITKGKVSIAHNGQVYNYTELNAGLGSKEAASDSEVIANFLSSRLEHGETICQALKQFSGKAEGEYAIGIMHGKKLYAYRDFTGQKPIWYGQEGTTTAFASEPSALSRVGIQFPAPLPPGHLLQLTKQGPRTTKQYTMQDFRKTVPKKHSAQALRKAFEHTIATQCAGLEKAAVLFSGGVDSSTIAKAVSGLVTGTRLFVAGTEESSDIANAESAAAELGLPLEKTVLRENEVQRLALASARAMAYFDAMQAAIAVPEMACAEKISGQGFKVVFSGQGSDEIFCGYSSYLETLNEKGEAAVQEETWGALARMWSRNFHRDDAVISSQSLELRLPFMSREFLRQAMAFSPSEKITSREDKLRKHPMRRLATELGIPHSIASRQKKAMQYGAGTQKIITKTLGH